jgi:hypothetical protein
VINPSESKIVVLAAARNVEKDVEKSIFKIMRALSSFYKIRFVIVESYSSDSTLKKLKEISKTSSEVEYFSIGNGDELANTLRTQRIANARNYAKDVAFEKYSNFDYVAVADLDNVNSALTRKGVDSCWNFNNWNAMFANQGKYYYDIWALKHKLWNPDDCWELYRKLLEDFSEANSLQIAVKSKEIRISPDSHPIKVQSAFGGFAIYDSQEYFKSSYRGLDKDGNEVCEHIAFHESFMNKNFYINPKMINISITQQRLGIWKSKIGQLW